MRYMGSKRRISKYLLPIMLSERAPGQCWVEPFVGGANMIDKVTGWRIGSDSNRYLIALLREMQTQAPFDPPFIDEQLYNCIKRNRDDFPDWLVGYAGFNLSFGATFFGSYARSVGKCHNGRAQRNLCKQQPNLIGVEFTCCDYQKLCIPPASLIYCDPPYRGTTGYHGSKFDSDIFFDWCRAWSAEGHKVFISEYAAPEDFRCVWEGELPKDSMSHQSSAIVTERLFTI